MAHGPRPRAGDGTWGYLTHRAQCTERRYSRAVGANNLSLLRGDPVSVAQGRQSHGLGDEFLVRRILGQRREGRGLRPGWVVVSRWNKSTGSHLHATDGKGRGYGCQAERVVSRRWAAGTP